MGTNPRWFYSSKEQGEASSVWITQKVSRQLVHKWRGEEHSILVGTTTILDDNPSLDVRSWRGENPLRIVIDKDLKIPKDLKVYDDSVKTILINQKVKLKSIFGGILLGVPNYFSIVYLLKALSTEGMESSTAFTLNNVGIVILSTLFGLFIFNEKLISKNWVGIGIAVVSITLIMSVNG